MYPWYVSSNLFKVHSTFAGHCMENWKGFFHRLNSSLPLEIYLYKWKTIFHLNHSCRFEIPIGCFYNIMSSVHASRQRSQNVNVFQTLAVYMQKIVFKFNWDYTVIHFLLRKCKFKKIWKVLLSLCGQRYFISNVWKISLRLQICDDMLCSAVWWALLPAHSAEKNHPLERSELYKDWLESR